MPPQASEQRRLRYREDARRSILDAAAELLDEGGLDGVSMRRLGERSGFTTPTLYHYFRDKPALLDALLEERLDELLDELRKIPRSEDTVAWFSALSGAFARFGLRHPSHYQLLVRRSDEDAENLPAAEAIRAIFGEPLDDMVRRGPLNAREVERLRQGLWSFVHGFILLQTTRPGEAWEPDVLEASLEAMIRGSLEARTEDRR
ncbi:MAG: TetR/AcrR family transcriptional regulator [Myxococcales bacterium]|nr:TetR/AcrR family transcriptional regulator [Myxococcales bacterium]